MWVFDLPTSCEIRSFLAAAPACVFARCATDSQFSRAAHALARATFHYVCQARELRAKNNPRWRMRKRTSIAPARAHAFGPAYAPVRAIRQAAHQVTLRDCVGRAGALRSCPSLRD
jgi:hypothetical protein